MRQVWFYGTSTGNHYGIFSGYSDFGGTDVSYRFHRLGQDGLPIRYDNGGICLDVVFGSALKASKRVGAVHDGEPYQPRE